MITVTITEIHITTKNYETDEVRAMIHAKGGRDLTIAEFVAMNMPEEIRNDVMLHGERITDDTWDVLLDGSPLED